MTMLYPDTPPEVEDVQIELLRKATVARRFSIMCSLTRTAGYLSRRAIQRAHPEWSEREVDIEFVALHHGEELAERLRLYLERQQP